MNQRLAKYQRATFALLIGLALMLATVACAQKQSQPNDRFSRRPQPGTPALDFVLRSTAGETIRASALWTNKPTLTETLTYQEATAATSRFFRLKCVQQ